jgi:hypothetical protein
MAERNKDRHPRWGTRTEGMIYAKLGATKMNELLQSGKIVAKKVGGKIIVDLNSIDDLYDGMPDVKAKSNT